MQVLQSSLYWFALGFFIALLMCALMLRLIERIALRRINELEKELQTLDKSRVTHVPFHFNG